MIFDRSSLKIFMSVVSISLLSLLPYQ
ncbi:hypothetical protein CBM2615_B140197 [Cupriavidus taiwanensis]|nr:hypothetical protein CBM2614_B150139 [Cupriavidus taiwanensis]SOZ64361.1 hypothetical protein CBM2615_B140197 [Cupriavidus taiwanensis]SPA07922.1 hypothetical protein CBM2625_B110197 [Cupriavidus taiwanensis]